MCLFGLCGSSQPEFPPSSISPWHNEVYNSAPGTPPDLVFFTEFHYSREIKAANGMAIALLMGDKSHYLVEGKPTSYRGSSHTHIQTSGIFGADHKGVEVQGWEPEDIVNSNHAQIISDPLTLAKRNRSLVQTALQQCRPGAGSDPDQGPSFLIAGQAHLVEKLPGEAENPYYAHDLIPSLSGKNFVILKAKTQFSDEAMMKQITPLYTAQQEFPQAFYNNLTKKFTGAWFPSSKRHPFISSMQPLARKFREEAVKEIQRFQKTPLAFTSGKQRPEDLFKKELPINITYMMEILKPTITRQFTTMHPVLVLEGMLRDDLTWFSDPEMYNSAPTLLISGDNLFMAAAWQAADCEDANYEECYLAGGQAYLKWVHQAISFVFDSIDKDPDQAEEEFNLLVKHGILTVATAMRETAGLHSKPFPSCSCQEN